MDRHISFFEAPPLSSMVYAVGQDIQVELADKQNSFGQVKSSSIKLRGPVLPFPRKKRSKVDRLSFSNAEYTTRFSGMLKTY